MGQNNNDNPDKYCWIKLYTDFFSDDSAIDFLLSQQNGAEYVVLYLKLLLATANTGGVLGNYIGEILIPYSIEKISRDMKFFSTDTVRVALELFSKLGLVYFSEEKGVLRLAEHDYIVGAETKYAAQKREYRKRKKLENAALIGDEHFLIADKSKDNVVDIVADNVVDIVQTKSEECPRQLHGDVRTEKREESREKRVESRELRDKSSSSSSSKYFYVFMNSENQIVWENLIKTYEDICNTMPEVGSLSEPQRKRVRRIVREFGSENVMAALKKAARSEWLNDDSKGWICDFDWIFTYKNFLKILDDKFEKKYRKTE